MSSKGVMQQLKMSVDRQLLAGMVARAYSYFQCKSDVAFEWSAPVFLYTRCLNKVPTFKLFVTLSNLNRLLNF